jgi:Zn-dependent protease with chaperone function
MINSPQQIVADIQKHVPLSVPGAAHSFAYKVALLVAAFTMILIPLLYLAMIGGIIYGISWHAVHNYAWAISKPLSQLKIVFYLTVIVAGGYIVVYLLRPIVAPPKEQFDGLALREQEEPEVFALVRSIASALGAPMPHHIVLDLSVNASASTELLGSRTELTLRLGAPLIATLSTSELISVIAHELGHFRQSLAAKCNWFMHKIIFIMWYRVYGDEGYRGMRDRLDKSQEAIGNNIFILTILGARLGTFLTQQVLRCFFYLANIVSFWFLRKQEFDSDRAAALIAGVEDTKSAFVSVDAADKAIEAAFNIVSDCWADGVLPDNIVELSCIALASGYARKEGEGTSLGNDAKEEKVAKVRFERLFDSHPSHEQRMAKLSQCTFKQKLPNFGAGNLLLNNFPLICGDLTRKMYQKSLEKEYRAELCIPAAAAFANTNRRDQEYISVARVFQGRVNICRILGPVPDVFLPDDVTFEDVCSILSNSKNYLTQTSSEYINIVTELLAARKEIDTSKAKLECFNSGVLLPTEKESIPPEQMPEHVAKLEIKEVELRNRAVEYEGAAVMYVNAILYFVENRKSHPKLESLLVDVKQLQGLLLLLQFLKEHETELFRLLSHERRLGFLLGAIYGEFDTLASRRRLKLVAKGAATAIETLFYAAQRVANPFAKSDEVATLQNILVPKYPDKDDPLQIFACACDTNQRFMGQYTRVYAEIAYLSEAVEAALGLEKNSEPDKKQLSKILPVLETVKEI